EGGGYVPRGAGGAGAAPPQKILRGQAVDVGPQFLDADGGRQFRLRGGERERVDTSLGSPDGQRGAHCGEHGNAPPWFPRGSRHPRGGTIANRPRLCKPAFALLIHRFALAGRRETMNQEFKTPSAAAPTPPRGAAAPWQPPRPPPPPAPRTRR